MRDRTADQRFLRPAKRTVRRARRPLATTAGIALAVVACLIGGGVVGQELHLYLNQADAFRVRTVALSGAQRTAAALDPLAIDLIGTNLLGLDLDATEAQLRRAQPWVRGATLRRVLPGRLEVSIEEHVAAARLDNGSALLGTDGAIRPAVPSALGDGDLPTLIGVDGKSRRESLASAIALLDILRTKASLWQRLVAVDVSDRSDLVVALRDAPYSLHLGDRDFTARLERFQSVEPVLEARYEGNRAIDLRYTGRLVVAPIDDPTERTSGS